MTQSKHHLFFAAMMVVLCLLLGLYVMGMGFWSMGLLGDPAGGVRGDFFGGHFGPAIGSWTLAVVIWTSYWQQRKQQEFFAAQTRDGERFFIHQTFVDGLNLIAQWDIKEPGCPQAMRLLDYYCRVALQRKDDELLLLLNTVITDKIRKNLKDDVSDQSRRDNYMFARDALEKIGEIRKVQSKAHKRAVASSARPK